MPSKKTTKLQTQARALEDQYQVILRQEAGEWYGRGLEMPYVFGDGKTPTACLWATREAAGRRGRVPAG